MKSHSKSKKILEFARGTRAVTTSEVAARFKISWNTAEKHLLELGLEGKLIRLKKQGVNIWLPK